MLCRFPTKIWALCNRMCTNLSSSISRRLTRHLSSNLITLVLQTHLTWYHSLHSIWISSHSRLIKILIVITTIQILAIALHLISINSNIMLKTIKMEATPLVIVRILNKEATIIDLTTTITQLMCQIYQSRRITLSETIISTIFTTLNSNSNKVTLDMGH